MRKRWSPWRAAIWGLGVGVFSLVGALTSRENASMSDAERAGQITFSIITVPILFALGAAIRNWAVGNPTASNISALADNTRPRRGIPDWLVIPLAALVGELHRIFLAPLLAAVTMIATVGRDLKAHVTTFLTLDQLFQWLGLAIIFLVAMAVSRSRSPRCAHWLAAFSVLLGFGLRLAQYASGGYPLWYEIAFPLGSVFAWAIALWYIAGRSAANSMLPGPRDQARPIAPTLGKAMTGTRSASDIVMAIVAAVVLAIVIGLVLLVAFKPAPG